MLAPRHTAAMSSLAAQHPAFGATVRLCRRWVHAHLLSAALPAELVDLLVAHVFTSPGARPPASALLGLLRFSNPNLQPLTLTLGSYPYP